VSDFNILFSPRERSSRYKKINKETSELNDNVTQIDETDIYEYFI
jgi:hypothetical protein